MYLNYYKNMPNQYPNQKQSYRPSTIDDYTQTRDAFGIAEQRQLRELLAGREPRPSISRDTPIDGGVYEGKYGGEAIVVDSKKYPLLIQSFHEILDRVTVDGQVRKNLILDAVYDLVSERMHYSLEGVERILQKAGGEDGTKIALDMYIGNGIGVCRHQALYAGVLLEMLGKAGFVSGKVSVDRNRVLNDIDDKYDGHAWARYTNSVGEVYIIDPAQRRIGSLSEFMERRNGGEKNVWDYARKEDHLRHVGRSVLEYHQW